MTETALEAGSHPEVVEQPTETPEVVEKPVDPNITANGEKLDRQTRNWRALETDRDHWRELALQYARPKQETPPAPEPTETFDKTLADFNYDEGEYRAHLREEIRREAAEVARREVQQQHSRETARQRETSFKAREAEFAKTADDYHAIAHNPSLPITEGMAEAILESEDGPALAYYLGKNPDVTAKLAQLPPLVAAREIGKIEARLAFEREKPKEVVSKAPPPPPKIEGAQPGNLNVKPDDPESDKLSDAEWTRQRNKQLARKKG